MKTLKFIKYCEDSSQLAESSSKYYILDITIVLSIYKLRTFSCVFLLFCPSFDWKSQNCKHKQIANKFLVELQTLNNLQFSGFESHWINTLQLNSNYFLDWLQLPAQTRQNVLDQELILETLIVVLLYECVLSDVSRLVWEIIQPTKNKNIHLSSLLFTQSFHTWRHYSPYNKDSTIKKVERDILWVVLQTNVVE